jgi:glycine betaine/proline transport system substrate-binding protein
MTGLARIAALLAGAGALLQGTAACSDATESGTGDATVTMGRADWATGWFQAALYAELLTQLGYDVTDPAGTTRDPNGFYPMLARGDVDLWANGWFPLHDPYLEGSEPMTGRQTDEDIEVVGTQVEQGAVQGYLVDKRTADEYGVTSMSDLEDTDVATLFDDSGDGRADLRGCPPAWGCHGVIDDHLAELDWGANVDQLDDDYVTMFDDVRAKVDAGEPVLFTTWLPTGYVAELVPGDDVVWLESPALDDDRDETTAVEGLHGCATGADSCDLGWVVNDIRVAANGDFLDDHPDIDRLLEAVEIPLEDILEQNADMAAATSYSEDQIRDDAREWIAAHRSQVDRWLERAEDG